MLSVVKETPVLSLSGNPFAVEALFEVLAGGYLTDMEASRYLQKNQMKALKQTFVKTGKMKRIVKKEDVMKAVYIYHRSRKTVSLRTESEVTAW